jgi:phosphatidylinositol alpha-1,6-mannosyltransferase
VPGSRITVASSRCRGRLRTDNSEVPDALLVSSSFLPGRGGIESHLAQLCARLAPRLAVLAPAYRDGKPIPDDLGYPIHAYHGSALIPSRRLLHSIEAAANAHGTRRVLFGTPWPLALIGPQLRERELRYGVIVHGAETIAPGAIPQLRTRLAQALASADLLLPVSDFTATKLVALLQDTGFDVPRLALLRAGVDLERFHPRAATEAARRRLAPETGGRVVLCFGRLVRRKGVHRLLRALPAITERVPDVTCAIVGTGPEERRLRRLARRLGIRATFLGRVSDDDAPGVYASADVFALPVADRWFGLDVEGLGVVLLEAAACEVACVAGGSGGTPEAVEDGVTGCVVDARDRNALANAIVGLLEDASGAREMGRAGRRLVESRYSGAPPQALLDWLDS